MRMIISRLVLIALIAHGLLCTSAIAESVTSFLRTANGNSVENVFSERPDLGEKPTLKFFPEQRSVYDLSDKEKEQTEKDKKQKAEEEEAQEDPKALAKQRKPLKSKGDIIEAFGDPEESEAVLAQTDAPKPFQGMLQAMSLGDKKLAWAYAKKYVRYVRDLQENNRDIVGFIAKAMEKEGLQDGEGWTGSPSFDKYNKFLEEDIAKEKAAADHEALLDSVDEETRKLLEQAELAESGVKVAKASVQEEDGFDHTPESPARILETTTSARAKIRQQLAGRVPFAHDGKVTVSMYFRPKDKTSQMLGRELQKLAEAFKDDPRVRIQASIVGSALISDSEYFRKKTGATYMIDVGGMSMGGNANRRIPSIEYQVDKTGQIFAQDQLRAFLYMHEVVRMMQGGF